MLVRVSNVHQHVSRKCGECVVGIRPVFIDMFLGSAVSVSEQEGIRPVFIDMYNIVASTHVQYG